MKNATVLQRTYELLRFHNATTIFGNPGSNELPFIADLPDGFRYVLCLHEGVAASKSGTKSAIEMMLTNVDATLLTKPITKGSYEPLSPQDVPRAVSNGVLEALTEPRGPTYLSIPWDDWAATANPNVVLLASRTVQTAGHLSDELIKDLAARMSSWANPMIILGPNVDADRAQGAAVTLAEKLGAPVFVAPSASRCPFPTTRANFRGVLEPSQKKIKEHMEGHDGVLIVGAPIFRYHQYQPDSYVPAAGIDAIHLTVDPSEAARAPFANSIVCSIGPALTALGGCVKDRGVKLDPRPKTAAKHVEGQMTGDELLDVIADNTPDTVTYVNEVTPMSDAFMDRVPITRPDGYKLCASGGLGFGLAAAVGVALARPNDTVVATIGDGSSNYAIQALYTAVTHKARVGFVIFNNSKYGAVIHLAEAQGPPDAPGLEIPGIDFMGLARGYGVPAVTNITNLEDFEKEYKKALKAKGPVLIEAKIAFT
ncbi:hypothetical protein CspeluHIS016_0500090 [Cutaneotrichosporon spelunceum]|uniref:Pyruvate decarboxylase n=1 Tax=Cutaneotrichosporon spelunceum TaxID=1672016 RepID=A0AAD3TW50_9TREE|nr:hypothetical protein CspeluHIS016_0500090 [Cutaneotrichosporon spelunceum]